MTVAIKPAVTMRLRLIVTLLILTMALLLPIPAYAAPGDLDPTFGDGGIVISSIVNDSFTITDSVLQPDGKLLLVGSIFIDDTLGNSNTNTFITRLRVDGSADPSFGNQGIVMTDIGTLLGRDPQSANGADDWAIAVALMKDGRFAVTVIDDANNGDNFVVARYLADGKLDTDFGGDGVVISNIGALIGSPSSYDSSQTMEVMDDGRIVVAGYTNVPNTPSSDFDFDEWSDDIVIVRYLADGTLDTSFSGDGIVVVDIHSFLGGEVGSNDRIYAMKLTEDGQIVIAGSTSAPPSPGNQFLVMHYRADGTLETDFDGDGIVITDMDPVSGDSGGIEYIESLALTEDGRIIVVGLTYGPGYAHFVVVRYLANGALDATFSNDGVIVDDLSGRAIHFNARKDSVAKNVAVIDDGRIVVAGYIGIPGFGESIAVRYLTDGTLDTTFGRDGVVITIINPEESNYNSYATSMIVMEDGRMVLVGSNRFSSGKKLVATRHLGDTAPQYDTQLALPILHR